MSKRPTDHLEPAAKKRGNDRQLTKDDPSDDDEVVHEYCPAHFGYGSADVVKHFRSKSSMVSLRKQAKT